MSIRQQVEDAELLAQNGRYLGALTNLLLAVGASSRKLFPKGTKSLENPKKYMPDGEAFTLFLGGRIRKILFGDFDSPEFGTSGIALTSDPNVAEPPDLAETIYKDYRCALVHEAKLAENVEFAPSDGSTQLPSERSWLNIRFTADNKLILNYELINLLHQVVVEAPCNGAEFGIKHYKLIPKPNVDENVLEETIVEKHDITSGRFSMLRDAVRFISPEVIEANDDRQVIELFDKVYEAGILNGGAITGLSTRGLTDRSGRLQPKGLAVLREIAGNYSLVEV